MSENVDVAVGVVNGKVVAQWHKPVNEIVFDPKNAYTVSLALGRAALEAHKGSAGADTIDFVAGELVDQKIRISDARRSMLVMQASTILKSLREQSKPDGYCAQHIVDLVLADTAK